MLAYVPGIPLRGHGPASLIGVAGTSPATTIPPGTRRFFPPIAVHLAAHYLMTPMAGAGAIG